MRGVSSEMVVRLIEIVVHYLNDKYKCEIILNLREICAILFTGLLYFH